MADITVQLVSVDRLLWSGQASSFTAQTTEGEIGVLPGHEPLLGRLAANGIVTLTDAATGEFRVAAVQKGFLSVSAEKITVLAEQAIWSDEVDEEFHSANLNSEDKMEKARAEGALKALRRASQA